MPYIYTGRFNSIKEGWYGDFEIQALPESAPIDFPWHVLANFMSLNQGPTGRVYIKIRRVQAGYLHHTSYVITSSSTS